MQDVTSNRDRTVRLSGRDHYTLKLLSLSTGMSVKQLISTAVPLLTEQYPILIERQQPDYEVFPPEPHAESQSNG